MESTCSVDITYFPFDSQTCEVKFTAWSYVKAEVEISAKSYGLVKDEFVSNSAWEVTETGYREVDSGEAAVIFILKLKRKSSFYVINIITPVILLSLLNIFTFVLPVTSGEKAGYSVTVFLSLAVFLTIIASELPKNSDVVSLMSVYLMLMSFLSTFIVCICLVEMRLVTRTIFQTPISKPFLFLIKISIVCRCQCGRNNLVRPITESADAKASTMMQEYDWLDVINALDVLLFWLSGSFTFLCTTVIFGICLTN